MTTIEDLINRKLEEAKYKELDKRPVSTARVVRIAAGVVPPGATCGGCRYLSFHGIMEVKLEYGDCERWKETDRIANHVHSEACPLWAQRSAAKMKAEAEYSRKMKEALVDICKGSKGPIQARIKVERPKDLDIDTSKPVKRTAKDALAELGIGVSLPGVMEDDDGE